uniref:acyl-CoA thioesterase n=1 Tax=Pseudomonas laurentiana TaxID=2364649 RepID=UPI0029C6A15D|nr:thioesterase family protein [Pseudomonas laurentiana]
MSETIQRQHYHHFYPVQTRWQDADAQGHIAGAMVYAFFDSALQAYLIERAELDPQDGEVVGFVVSSSCDFFASAVFPETLEVGLRVSRLAGSSVEYAVALFKADEAQACAAGRIVQVFVERATGNPASLPKRLQEALQALQQA